MVIDVVKYRYKVSDLVKFRAYNGNNSFREEIIGMIVKRDVLNCFWYEEAEKRVFQSGRDFLIYEVVYEGKVYTVKEDEVLAVISSKLD